MFIRFTETFFIDIDHSYALSQRADIINYVPTVAVFPHRTHVYLRCMADISSRYSALV